jgi:hypothetical protein
MVFLPHILQIFYVIIHFRFIVAEEESGLKTSWPLHIQGLGKNWTFAVFIMPGAPSCLKRKMCFFSMKETNYIVLLFSLRRMAEWLSHQMFTLVLLWMCCAQDFLVPSFCSQMAPSVESVWLHFDLHWSIKKKNLTNFKHFLWSAGKRCYLSQHMDPPPPLFFAQSP